MSTGHVSSLKWHAVPDYFFVHGIKLKIKYIWTWKYHCALWHVERSNEIAMRLNSFGWREGGESVEWRWVTIKPRHCCRHTFCLPTARYCPRLRLYSRWLERHEWGADNRDHFRCCQSRCRPACSRPESRSSAATVSLAYGVSRTVRRRPSGCHYSCDSAPCRRGGIGHDLPRPRHKHGYPGGSCGHRDGERGAGGRGLRTRSRGGLIVLSSIGLGVQRGLGVRETARTTGRK